MKTALTLLATVLALATANAQFVINVPFNFSGTVLVQNGNTNTGTYTIDYLPEKHTVSTAALLPLLAQGEFTKGNYPTNKFPSGAKLVMALYPTNFSQTFFKVTDSAGNLLVDVSDIIKIGSGGSRLVESGKTSNTTGLFTGKTASFLMTITYDDTGAFGGNTQFEAIGLMMAAGNDTVVYAAGHTYKETWALKWINGSGEGQSDGDDMVVYIVGSGTGSGMFVY